MKLQALAVAVAVAIMLSGCTLMQQKDPGILVQEKYIVPIPPAELTTPPDAEREAQMRQLDPEKATDKDLAELLLDKQAYINALEKRMAALRKWYVERLELLKQTIKPEDIRTVE